MRLQQLNVNITLSIIRDRASLEQNYRALTLS
ncbi:MAG: hypothetical protein ACI91R_000690 [Vicingaceae bacterium]|jgi:hypothetical protein